MNITKSKAYLSIVSIGILLVSLAILIVDVVVPLNFWTHAVLNFLFCLFTGFGFLSLFVGFKNKSAWFIFVGAVLIAMAMFYMFIQYLFWWVALVIAVVFLSITSILDFMFLTNITEQVDNDNPEYKNYEQRMAEKIEAEKNQDSEELPQIKSFK